MDTNRSNHDSSIVSHPFAATFIRVKARQLCRRTDFSRSDHDDLQQDMRMYLLEKAHLFDPDRGNIEAFITKTLSTWVAMRLRFQERDKRRDSHKVASLEGTLVECDGGLAPLGAALLEEDGDRRTQSYSIGSLEQVELRDLFERVMQNLKPEDREVLHQVAEHGLRSAVRSLGLSRRHIEKVMARVRRLTEEKRSGRRAGGRSGDATA